MCSGFESYSRNGGYIYSHGANELYVNLFVASAVTWKEKGLTLRQETEFPDQGSASFRLSLRQPARFSLYLRYPAWSPDSIKVQVNGTTRKVTAVPGEWFALDREWRDGDTVLVKAPLAPRYESMPDNPDRLALFAGPILLAGDVGPAIDPATEDPNYVPLLVPGTKPVSHWLRATGTPLTFTTTVARPRQIAVQPFFRLRDCSYAVYWDRVTPAGWGAHVNDVKQQREQARQMEARTVDKVTVGDSASETAHRLEGGGDSITGRGSRGLVMHLAWRQARAGKTIAYRMRVPRDKPAVIRCRYATETEEEDVADFDIEVGGTTIARERPRRGWRPPPDVLVVEYPIPTGLTEGKDEIQVLFRAAASKRTGNLTDLRILTR